LVFFLLQGEILDLSGLIFCAHTVKEEKVYGPPAAARHRPGEQ